MADEIAPFYMGDKKRNALNTIYSDGFAAFMFISTILGGAVSIGLTIWFMIILSPVWAFLLLIPGIGITYFTSAKKIWSLAPDPGYDTFMKRYQKLPEEIRDKLKPIAKDYNDLNFTGNNSAFQKLVNEYYNLNMSETTERNRELISELEEDLEIRKEDAEKFAQARKEAEAARERARKEVADINRNVIESVKASKK